MSAKSSPETPALGPFLRTLREDTGMLQGELADRAGISASFLSKLEHGVYPDVRVSTLYRLAKALGYDVRIEFTPKR